MQRAAATEMTPTPSPRRAALCRLGSGALALVLGAAGCGARPAIRIGWIGGLSGRSAAFSEDGRNGVILGVEQRNEAGGVAGRALELLVQDHGEGPERAGAAFQALVDADVAAVIGPYASDVALALLPVIERAQRLVLSPTVTAVGLAGRDDHLLRLSRTTRDNAQSLAAELHALGHRRLSLAVDLRNPAYYVAWRDDFRAAFAPLGGSIVAEAEFNADAGASLDRVVFRALQGRPDALVAVTSSNDAALVAQLVARHPLAVPMVAIAASDALLELGGRSVEGMVVAQAYNRADPSPRHLAFVAAYRARFGRAPGYSAIASYDAIGLLAQAVERAAPGQSLRDAVLRHQPYQGVQDIIRFDGNGDATRPAYFSIVRNGRFEPL